MTVRGRPWAVIAAGGTAGHVVPGLAIGNALVQRGHDHSKILFVGSRRGIEARLVPEAGFRCLLLPGRGIARRLTFDNVGAVLGLASAAVQAAWLVGRRRPAVVVSLGGYAAAACALAAIVFRVPLVLAEQNAIPTATHRLVARFARAAAVSFDGTPLPRAVRTGNPVRADLLGVDTSPSGAAAARRQLELPEDRVVLLGMGGSLGARRVNEALIGLAEKWRERGDVAIRHVIGERDWSLFAPRIAALTGADRGLQYQAIRYEEAMPAALAAADLVVGRAGGATVSELAIVGRASVLVPLPIAPYDHQTYNAQALVDAGAAVLVPDPEFTADRLEEVLAPLVAERERLAMMGRAAQTLAVPDAADRVAQLVEQSARHGEGSRYD